MAHQRILLHCRHMFCHRASQWITDQTFIFGSSCLHRYMIIIIMYIMCVQLSAIMQVSINIKAFIQSVSLSSFLIDIHDEQKLEFLDNLRQSCFIRVMIDGATDSSNSEDEIVYVIYVNHGLARCSVSWESRVWSMRMLTECWRLWIQVCNDDIPS